MQLMTCYRPWTSESESVSQSRRAALVRLLACKNVLEVQCDARPLLLRSLTRRLAESTTTIIIIIIIIIYTSGASVLWRCWLGGRKGIRPIKNWVLECWHGYLSATRCRLAYGPADATATHCLLLQSNPDWVLPFWHRVCVCVFILQVVWIPGVKNKKLKLNITGG